jgi:hypothetical protein
MIGPGKGVIIQFIDGRKGDKEREGKGTGKNGTNLRLYAAVLGANFS